MMKALVLGGGITGMFVAYSLARTGFDVTIVEKNRADVPTSIFNAGLIAPCFTPAPKWSNYRLASAAIWPRGPVYLSPKQVIRNPGWFYRALRAGVFSSEDELWGLSLKGYKLYEEFFAREKVDVDLIRGGVSVSLHREAAMESARLLKGRFLEPNECLELGFEGFEGGTYFEESFAVNPPKLFSEVRRVLRENGVNFRLGNPARLEVSGRKIASVAVDGESLVGDVFVATCGAESREILKPLGYDPQVLPALGMAMIFETGGAKVVGYPTDVEDYGIAVNQHSQNTIRVTSFMEFVGFQQDLPNRRKEWLLAVIKKHLCLYGKLRLVQEGVGYRPCTPDQLGVVGKVPGCENLYVATGNNRVGVALAPATGYIIASLISGQQPEDVDWRCLDPSRFYRKKD